MNSAARQTGLHTAYVALGSNLGPRRQNLRRAVRLLEEHQGVRVVRVSSMLETEPVGGPPQGPYLNAAAELRTELAPRPLLEVLLSIEDELGRQRTVRWGPRTLDLDLLLYENRTIEEPGLRVPHPRMHERRFVLQPLCEIAPEAVHPVLQKTARELLAGLPEE